MLDIVEEENLVANSARVGRYMLCRFRKMQQQCKYLGEARGQGLAMGLELVKDKKTREPAAEVTVEVINRAAAQGLLVGRVGIYGNVIRVAPPLVISKAEAEKSCDIMAKVLKSL